jgi:hypothetical protein
MAVVTHVVSKGCHQYSLPLPEHYFMLNLVNPLMPVRHIHAAYNKKFIENSVLKISQSCFFVPTFFG